jgi:hypothetical protein
MRWTLASVALLLAMVAPPVALLNWTLKTSFPSTSESDGKPSPSLPVLDPSPVD